MSTAVRHSIGRMNSAPEPLNPGGLALPTDLASAARQAGISPPAAAGATGDTVIMLNPANNPQRLPTGGPMAAPYAAWFNMEVEGMTGSRTHHEGLCLLCSH